MLYVYALLGERIEEPGVGLAGEPLRLVRAAGLGALAGEVAAPPAAAADALRAHDAVVRRAAARCAAVLPARFGTVVADDDALAAALDARAGVLAGALALVAGREQMTVRVFAEPDGVPAGAEPPATGGDGPGPGARHLAALARRRSPAWLAALRRALASRVEAERVERHATPPLVASVYHLVARGAADEYRSAVDAARAALEPARVTISGPWPAYAFAPRIADSPEAVA